MPPPQRYYAPPECHPIPTTQKPPGFAHSSAASDRPPHQICIKFGHTAPTCNPRLNFAYQGRAPPQNISAMLTSDNVFGENPWFVDSGYNNHTTADEESITITLPSLVQMLSIL